MADTTELVENEKGSWQEKDQLQLYKAKDCVEMNRVSESVIEPPSKSRFQVAKVEFMDEENPPRAELEDLTLSEQQNSLTSGPTSPGHGSSYDTRNQKSLRHLTREALPRVDHYRNVMSVAAAHLARPTLEELHEKTVDAQNADWATRSPLTEEFNFPLEQKTISTSPKFGWVKGVLVRCLLNIWGVMLFLRLSWIVGQAGIGLASLVILLATVVTTITALSMSAICTNGEVKGGGAYYMISRSLGPEFGGAIGMVFSLANAVAVAMYVVGFAETVRDIMKENLVKIVDNSINDIRIIGCCSLVLILIIALIGMEWEARAQIILLLILLTSIVDFIVGTFLNPSEFQSSRGFQGYRVSLVKENFGPMFRKDEGFFSVFGIFFPAATGILAGANISGDLIDAQKSIPKGTLIAIVITTFSYLMMVWMCGGTTLRDASGSINDIHSSNLTDCAYNQSCLHGLLNNYQVVEMIGAFGPIITAGIFSATLSSALASLVSAPKVFQALCKDKLFPYIEIFAVGSGKNSEPHRAYFLTFFIAFAVILIGDLNVIAPIISNFFLMAYGLINFSCFDASLAKSPGFRPAFKYYSMWLSLVGAFLCLGVMFIINWWAALLTFVIIGSLGVYIHHSKPDVNWGSSTQAHNYKSALTALYKLNKTEEHVKNFRPQVLVLTGNPCCRPSLIDFVAGFTRNIGLMVCGHVILDDTTERAKQLLQRQVYQWLQKRKVRSFYSALFAPSLRLGVHALLQLSGLGKMRPNILVMGFKQDWFNCDIKDVQEYFEIIHDAFDQRMGLGILRVREGLDYSFAIDDDNMKFEDVGMGMGIGLLAVTASRGLPRNNSQLAPDVVYDDPTPPATPSRTPVAERKAFSNDPSGSCGPVLRTESETNDKKITPGIAAGMAMAFGGGQTPPAKLKLVMDNINKFHRKQKKGNIDVWWLFDDGGLTLLLPYVLSSGSQWSGCKLRVFFLANRKDELDTEQRNMAALLSKFRIDYSDVTAVSGVNKRANETTQLEFQNLIQKFSVSEDGECKPGMLSESEILAMNEKTNRQLRLRELLLEHSKDAAMIFMTLPMPRKGTCSAAMYMAWLDMLTRNMPPIMLLRGNQSNVLTFYS